MTMIIKRPTLAEIMQAIEVLERKKRRRRIWITIGSILLVLVLLAGAAAFTVAMPTRYTGYAMSNTLKDGDIALVNRFIQSIERGDVVQCGLRDPGSSGMLFRRVIGVAGDVVAIDTETGRITVNGTELTEEYVINPGIGNLDTDTEITVGEGKLFLLGDNRAESIDSRSNSIGLVDSSSVVGKVWAVCYPSVHYVH